MGGDFFGHDHLIPTWSVSYVCESGVCSLRPDDLQTECQHAGVFCERESITTYMYMLCSGTSIELSAADCSLDLHVT